MSTLRTKYNSEKGGFTLLEILLVVGIIAILAGIVILAINPTKQLGDTRNAQRRSDVLTILNALYQYSIDNNGDMASTSDGTLIEDQLAANCSEVNGTDAYELTSDLVGEDARYLVSIPLDPSEGVTDTSSYYFVVQDRSGNGRITVCAPASVGEGNIPDGGNQIQVTR